MLSASERLHVEDFLLRSFSKEWEEGSGDVVDAGDVCLQCLVEVVPCATVSSHLPIAPRRWMTKKGEGIVIKVSEEITHMVSTPSGDVGMIPALLIKTSRPPSFPILGATCTHAFLMLS